MENWKKFINESTFAEKAEKAWQNIETINTPGGTIYGNEQIGFFPSAAEAQSALETLAAGQTKADTFPDYSVVTGTEGPPSEIYRDPIMDIAAEQAAKENALQEELEAYRDPIMDMEPAESVDLGNPLGDPRIVSEEQGLAGDPWLGYQDPIMDMANMEQPTVEIANLEDDEILRIMGQYGVGPEEARRLYDEMIYGYERA